MLAPRRPQPACQPTSLTLETDINLCRPGFNSLCYNYRASGQLSPKHIISSQALTTLRQPNFSQMDVSVVHGLILASRSSKEVSACAAVNLPPRLSSTYRNPGLGVALVQRPRCSRLPVDKDIAQYLINVAAAAITTTSSRVHSH